MFRDRRDTNFGSVLAPWFFLILLIVICGCTQSGSGPDPKYSDLSQKVHAVVVRTQGDPSKMSPADRQVMSDAKADKIITPPGY